MHFSIRYLPFLYPQRGYFDSLSLWAFYCMRGAFLRCAAVSRLSSGSFCSFQCELLRSALWHDTYRLVVARLACTHLSLERSIFHAQLTRSTRSRAAKCRFFAQISLLVRPIPAVPIYFWFHTIPWLCPKKFPLQV